MSRSALWRQEDNVKERERKSFTLFQSVIDEGRIANSNKGVIPLVGPDDTFNLHPMLLSNIWNSTYFQKCCEKITDWTMLVDEIYYEVKHMEPWTAGKSIIFVNLFCVSTTHGILKLSYLASINFCR